MVDPAYNSLFRVPVIEIWMRRKWLILAAFASILAIGGALIVSLPSIYRASTTILIGQEAISESLVRSGIDTVVDQRLQVIQQAILSRSSLQAVIAKFDLYREMRQKASPESVIKRMRKDISIEREVRAQGNRQDQGATVVLTITYQGWDADLVASVANELARLFEREYESMRLGQATRTTAFLQEQLKEVELRLAEREALVNEFKAGHLGQLPQQESMNLATLERLNSELRLNGMNQFQIVERLAGLNSQVEGAMGAGLSGKHRLNALKQELAMLSVRYNNAYPGIVRLKSEIAMLESMPEVTEVRENSLDPSTELDLLKEQEVSLRASIGELQRRIERTPTVDQELKRLILEADAVRQEFMPLQKRYQDARLAELLELQQTQQYQVLEHAIPPDFPSGPSQLRLLFFVFVLALGVSVALALLVEYLDTSFHTVRDLRSFTRLPVLGSISVLHTAGADLKRRFFSLLSATAFFACLIVAVVLVYRVGNNAEELVWMLAG